ncbi:hypothetical protein SAMN00790413_03399 [Deinococcus hopiensis KR-140]|uniref:Uncharacterized protein n=1 Tax=Deinococcus hopiensis KR-140 TaxID=695939 RepID=A0A1W1UWL4_9DEIO|nr:hypothetical protein SAMN00790413_03399 [Deinococcus hopiensis KR-140]
MSQGAVVGLCGFLFCGLPLCPRYPAAMHPANLTAVEIADQVHAAYQEDRRLAPAGPDEEERLALADDLGCYEEAGAEAWEAWQHRAGAGRGGVLLNGLGSELGLAPVRQKGVDLRDEPVKICRLLEVRTGM